MSFKPKKEIGLNSPKEMAPRKWDTPRGKLQRGNSFPKGKIPPLKNLPKKWGPKEGI